MIPVTVPVMLSATETTVPVQIGSNTDAIPVDLGLEVVVVGAENYEGSYEWTPTQETQTIPIYGLRAKDDIVINPIPSNYGKIAWNGAVLTVS